MFVLVIITFSVCRYFKNRLSIFCEFIPQIIFMCFLFLYMVMLMFIKWIIFFPTNVCKLSYAAIFDVTYYFVFFLDEYIQRSPGCAPSILITFINMVLFKPAKENPPCSPEMFDGQFALQKVLVVLALLCVPVMLLAKPIIILRSQNKSTEYSVNINSISSLDCRLKKKRNVLMIKRKFAFETIQYKTVIVYVLLL